MHVLIQCTKALLDKMNIGASELKSPEGYEELPHALMAWHANLVNMDRRKAVVLMNNATRYPVVIYRPKPKDFARMKDLIREAIVVALRMEGVSETVIDRYMADAGDIEFSKTASRSMVGKLNNAVYELGFMQDYMDENTPVSYTHLDVYKRQSLACAVGADYSQEVPLLQSEGYVGEDWGQAVCKSNGIGTDTRAQLPHALSSCRKRPDRPYQKTRPLGKGRAASIYMTGMSHTVPALSLIHILRAAMRAVPLIEAANAILRMIMNIPRVAPIGPTLPSCMMARILSGERPLSKMCIRDRSRLFPAEDVVP